jgi:hypothetical protein
MIRTAIAAAATTMLLTARDRMAKLVKDGKSEDDVVAAKLFADLDAKWAPTELASKISFASSTTRSPTSPNLRKSRCSNKSCAGAEKT